LHETKVKGLSRRLTKAETSVAELTKEVQELTERNRALNTMRVKDALMRAMTGGSARFVPPHTRHDTRHTTRTHIGCP
jgi:hypothetical protein